MPPGRGAITWRCAGSAGTASRATSPTPISRELTNRFANVLATLGVAAGRARLHAGRARSGALRRRARHARRTARLLPAVLGLRAGADPRSGWRSARRGCWSRPSALYRAKVAPLRDALPELEHVLLVGDGERPSHGTLDLRDADGGRQPTRSRSRPTDPRTWRCCISPAAPPARRRAPSTCTRPSSPTTSPAARARPAPGRHLLVHRRSRLGHRHLLRHHRAADHGVTSIVDEARVRRRALVPHPRRSSASPSGTPRRRRSAC